MDPFRGGKALRSACYFPLSSNQEASTTTLVPQCPAPILPGYKFQGPLAEQRVVQSCRQPGRVLLSSTPAVARPAGTVKEETKLSCPLCIEPRPPPSFGNRQHQINGHALYLWALFILGNVCRLLSRSRGTGRQAGRQAGVEGLRVTHTRTVQIIHGDMLTTPTLLQLLLPALKDKLTLESLAQRCRDRSMRLPKSAVIQERAAPALGTLRVNTLRCQVRRVHRSSLAFSSKCTEAP